MFGCELSFGFLDIYFRKFCAEMLYSSYTNKVVYCFTDGDFPAFEFTNFLFYIDFGPRPYSRVNVGRLMYFALLNAPVLENYFIVVFFGDFAKGI
jgi:hypothetical protein